MCPLASCSLMAEMPDNDFIPAKTEKKNSQGLLCCTGCVKSAVCSAFMRPPLLLTHSQTISHPGLSLLFLATPQRTQHKFMQESGPKYVSPVLL